MTPWPCWGTPIDSPVQHCSIFSILILLRPPLPTRLSLSPFPPCPLYYFIFFYHWLLDLTLVAIGTAAAQSPGEAVCLDAEPQEPTTRYGLKLIMQMGCSLGSKACSVVTQSSPRAHCSPSQLLLCVCPEPADPMLTTPAASGWPMPKAGHPHPPSAMSSTLAWPETPRGG